MLSPKNRSLTPSSRPRDRADERFLPERSPVEGRKISRAGSSPDQFQHVIDISSEGIKGLLTL